jgi:hypothetical protein
MTETFVCLEIGKGNGAAEKWASRANFAAFVGNIADQGQLGCARGDGKCCLTLNLEAFEPAADPSLATATVRGSCASPDCPSPDWVIHTVFTAMDRGEERFIAATGERASPPVEDVIDDATEMSPA